MKLVNIYFILNCIYIIKNFANGKIYIGKTQREGNVQEIGTPLATKTSGAGFGSSSQWLVISEIKDGATESTYADGWYYVEKGIKKTTTKLVKYNDKYYYVKSGKVSFTTGIKKISGKYYYIKSGKWSKSTTLYKKDGKYFKDTSRLGLKIRISNSHTLISMTVKINEKTYYLSDYMYNNASYTCPDTLPIAGDCKITITVRDILGQTDSKTMTLFVYDEVKAPPIPKIRFEFRMPKNHNRHFYFSEGEHVIFTGTSDNIEDYQIIYALAPCDIFNAFASHILKNSYADEDSDFISDRLEKNIR